MVKVFVVLNEPGFLTYMVTYKTKNKKKFVNKWTVVRGIITWRYK